RAPEGCASFIVHLATFRGMIGPMKLASAIAGVSLIASLSLATTDARADDVRPPANDKPVVSGEANVAIATPPPPTVQEAKPLLFPAILAGTGLAIITVGIVLAATAPGIPSTCNSDAKTCVRQPNESASDFQADQDRAGRAHTQPIAGWLTVG